MNQSELTFNVSAQRAEGPAPPRSVGQPKQIFNADGSVLHCQENGVKTLVDADTAKWLNFVWLVPFKKRTYLAVLRDKRIYYLHRMIMHCPPTLVVDHINGDTHDNRRCNLRICTVANNIRNRVVLNKNNKSGKRGVFYVPGKDLWVATLKHNRKTNYLGGFGTFEAAKAAREKAELEFWGGFKGTV